MGDDQTSATFDTIRARLFRLMSDKASGGDKAAQNFLGGTVIDGKLVVDDATIPPRKNGSMNNHMPPAGDDAG